jgi:hypothetical protein
MSAVTIAQRIQQAQSLEAYTVDGVKYPRICYGGESDDMSAALHVCRDCGVSLGQYHVVCCQFEECPRCHGQAISCLCEHHDTVRMLSGLSL